MADKYGNQLAAVERETRDILAKARAITGAAAEDGRGITEDEEKEIQGHLKSVDVLKEKRAEIQAAMLTRQKVEDAGKSMVIDEDPSSKDVLPDHRKALSIGEAFTKSAGYKKLLESGFQGKFSSGAVEIEGKTLLTTTGGAGLVGVNQPDIRPGIVETLFQRLTVADLCAQGTTTSSLVRYMRETAATNAAAGVAEGGQKPESTFTFDAVDESVKKIATFLPVTDEMLEDAAQLESYLNTRLALFVQIEEERELLNSTGTSNELNGIINRIPGANKGLRSSAASANDADHILRAIMRVRESFLEPDGIVIHPNDWEGIALMKDSQQRYQGNGPFQNEINPTLWGMRVVITQAVPEAKPVIGAWATGAQIFRKGGLTVEASNSHDTFFQYNKTAIRAEERLALAVYRPSAFAQADLGTAGAAT